MSNFAAALRWAVVTLVVAIAGSAVAVAQVTAVTNPSTPTAVAAADDYATRAFQDPWDMNQRTDLGWFLNGVDAPASSLTNITFSAGVFSAQVSASNDPNIYLLETGNTGAVAHGKIGTNYAIDADTYKIFVFRMNTTTASPAQFFWTRQTVYDSDTTNAYNVSTTTGWRIYLQDLRNLTLSCIPYPGGPACSSVSWGGTMRSLRFDPIYSGSGATVSLDWVRLVEVNSALCQQITWTGSGSVDIYLDDDANANNGTLGPIALSVSSGSASAGCSALGSGYNFYAGALPGGQYYVAAATAGATPNSSNLKYSPGYYQVNEIPTLTVTSPSDEGSSDDFATTQLGNAWDMNALSDIDLTNNVTGAAISTLTAEREDGASLGTITAYTGTSAVPTSGVGDPYVYPLWHDTRGATTHIDPDRYRVLTLEMGFQNKARDIVNGSIARLVWMVDGDAVNAENVSNDIIVNTRAGVNVAARINLDMKAVDLEAGAGSPSHVGWNALGGSNPGVSSFRVDPHEFSAATDFFIKRIKLAAFDTAVSSYTIQWTSSESSGTVTLYYDTDTNRTTKTLIGSTSVSSTTGSYLWDTSAVPNGTYYVYVEFSDGSNTNGTYGKWPVVVSSTCAYSLSPASQTMTASGGTGSVQVTTATACSWTASSDQSWLTITSGTSGTGNRTVNFSVSAQSSGVTRVAHITVQGQTFTLTQTGLCSYSVSPTEASYPATGGTGTITVTTSAGCGWTAVSNNAFITVTSGSSGSGSGSVGYSTPNTGNTDNRSGTMTIAGRTVTIHQAGSLSASPFGVVDTPANGTTGVTGSLGVTGWALDDLGISAVKIYRDAVAPEPSGASVYIGDATLVAGARPDVAAAYPSYPFKDRAGWGYMLLTNMLPDQGNGTYTLRIYAEDVEGHSVFLGSRTITCSNATATLPFGAIDTPAQGATISGASYVNFGWGLTPVPKTIPTNRSTITVYIDGAAVGNVTYNNYRSDIATFFPGYANTNGAIGYRYLDTTTYTDGVHTISWNVFDDAGAGAGIGSRYFTVQNGSSLTAAAVAEPTFAVAPAARMAALAVAGYPVYARVGFDPSEPLAVVEPDGPGRRLLTLPEVGRLEVHLGDGVRGTYRGALRVGDTWWPLPIGSQLDATTGVFLWQPGVGFVGTYELEFGWTDATGSEMRIPVTVVIRQKHSGTSRVQAVIDLPVAGEVTLPFVVAGWALDEGAVDGTGINTIHVWAYPTQGWGEAIFLGVATLEGARPDVAQAFGAPFGRAGYGLRVEALTPGTYDIAVFPHSTVTGAFAPAKVVRVTVRD